MKLHFSFGFELLDCNDKFKLVRVFRFVFILLLSRLQTKYDYSSISRNIINRNKGKKTNGYLPHFDSSLQFMKFCSKLGILLLYYAL